jgi:hypothetical protein
LPPPRRCGGPQDAIEPVNRKKNSKPIHQKNETFFCLEMSEQYFSFFQVANQYLSSGLIGTIPFFKMRCFFTVFYRLSGILIILQLLLKTAM